jgi:hypothetical protein
MAASPVFAAVLEESASQASFSAAGHTLVFSREDEIDPSAPSQNLMLHETTLRSGYRQYGLGVEFTSQLPFTKISGEHKPFNLEKKYATADWEKWKLVLGDNHVELGKGLALSLYRDAVFGIDNTLEGATVAYSGSGLRATAFGGRVNALRVPIALNPVGNPLLDRQVLMAGAEVKGKVVSDLAVGGHYLYASNRPTAGEDRRWNTIGASLAREGASDGVDAYLESNVLLTQRVGRNGIESLPSGYGTYASLSWVPAPWKFRVEGKDYRDYRFEFRRPPTLEEDIVETVNTENVSAARVSAEYRFLEAQAFAKASYLVGDDRLKQSNIHHGVVGGGFKGPGKTAWEVSAGYRVMPTLSDLTHAAIKSKIPTFEGQSVEVAVRRFLTRTDLSREVVRNDKHILDVTYNFSPKFNVGAGMELVPTNSVDTGKRFFNGSANVRLGAFALKGFVGTTSGGTLCSGGVCRTVPPFSGGSLESTYAF